ncbi:MAG: hypothetical protein HZB50_04390 [Chloroflexi bacterium]|nr:hypothetical protein [Chloroflexota bacterium]
MKTKFNLLFVFVVLGAMLLSACGGAPAPAATEAPVMVESPLYADPAAQGVGGVADESAKGASAPPANIAYATAMPPQDGAPAAASMHMIIKNSDLKLLVEDTDVAIDRATQIVGDAGGYIISSRVWSQSHYDGKSYKYATISIGIPVQ